MHGAASGEENGSSVIGGKNDSHQCRNSKDGLDIKATVINKTQKFKFQRFVFPHILELYKPSVFGQISPHLLIFGGALLLSRHK
jgi:hypothetical protein